MRSIPAAAALAAALGLGGGCAHHPAEAAGPEGLAYACGEAGTAWIVYDRGDPNRMPARLRFEGPDFALTPVPAASGLRYQSEELPEGRALVWQAEGDAAEISTIAIDPASAEPERPIAQCERVRESAAAPDAAQATRPPRH